MPRLEPYIPRVSIVIPTCNRPELLRKCVNACLELDYAPGQVEILVVDDGSEAPTGPGVQDPRVSVLRQRKAGPACARSLGIARARGELVVFTDDDCRPERDWLRKLVQAHRRRPGALLGGHTRNACRSNPYSAASQLLIDFLYQQFEAAPDLQRFFTSNNMAGAREMLMSLGGFSGSFPFAAAEDRDLCDRWVEAGGELVYVSDALVDHFHEMSLGGFLAQHFRYGRGARVLHRRRAGRGLKFRVYPLSFYMGMLIAPFRAARLCNAIRLAGLLVLVQLCNAAGYLYEAGRPARRSGTTEFEVRDAASPSGG